MATTASRATSKRKSATKTTAKKAVENTPEKEGENLPKNVAEIQDKTVQKTADNLPDNTPKESAKSYVDSDSGGLDQLKHILNVPMEKSGSNKGVEMDVPSDPFSTGKQKSEAFGDDDLGLDDIGDMEDLGELFEDHEALSEFAVEILDLGMNYTAQWIAKDFGNDEKYSIPESRKRKLRKPLGVLLKKRAPKVSPEMAFVVFVIGAYAPVLIMAYSERQKKTRMEQAEAEKRRKVKESTGVEVEPDSEEFDDMIKKMRENSSDQEVKTPKRPGRPKGSKDSKPRKKRVTTGGPRKVASSK